MESKSHEKLSIKKSIVSLKKYGSTNKRLPNVTLVKHIIHPEDTLQGIALKYGVSMEQIRRINRLWASDSLFLRQHLLIPLSENVSKPADNGVCTSTEKQIPVTSPNEDVDPCDFLSKIDASIANTKKEYRKTQHNSTFSQIYVMEKKQSNNNNQLSSYQNYSQVPENSMTPTNSKLRLSLQRLEQKQDELFEL